MKRTLSIAFVFLGSLCPYFWLSGVGFAEQNTVAVPVPKPSVENKQPTTTEKPQRVYQAACPAVLEGRVRAKTLPPINEGTCGERSPLEVYEIAGIELSSPATMNCRMAETLSKWVPEASDLAGKVLGSSLRKIQTSTSYQCRRRNNAPDGKISEHGFANALDVSGFVLESGQQISVLEGWPLSEPLNQNEDTGSETEGAEPSLEAEFLRLIHAAACKRFTTVLGPDSDPHHADHFHFDMGCHGKRCTYLICQ